jgi:hypothetical protein
VHILVCVVLAVFGVAAVFVAGVVHPSELVTTIPRSFPHSPPLYSAGSLALFFSTENNLFLV